MLNSVLEFDINSIIRCLFSESKKTISINETRFWNVESRFWNAQKQSWMR